MYRTCAFCNSKLDGDGGPSGLGVGRRLAFDEWKSRLWVICPKCSRWNLAPLDDRLEQIEALARAAGQGRVAAATEHVALIRWQTYDLVRVGKPRRMEFATWRYGERLRARRREQLKFVVPVTVAAGGLAAAGNASRTPPGWSKAPAGPTGSSTTWPVANSPCAASAWNGASRSKWPWTSARRSKIWSATGRRPRRSPRSQTVPSARTRCSRRSSSASGKDLAGSANPAEWCVHARREGKAGRPGYGFRPLDRATTVAAPAAVEGLQRLGPQAGKVRR